MQYGSPGTGSGSHLACALFNADAADLGHARAVSGTWRRRCRICSPAASITCARRSPPPCRNFEAHKIQAPAVLGAKRSAAFPDIPTAQEQGIKDFDANSWNAIFMPKAYARADRRQAQCRGDRGDGRAGSAGAAQAARRQPAAAGRAHPAILAIASSNAKSKPGARPSRPPASRRTSKQIAEFSDEEDWMLLIGVHTVARRRHWCAAPAFAQNWPTRPITLVVPFAAGGGVDVSARIQAQKIGELLGQSIVVDNMGGAAGMTGARARREKRARRLHLSDRQQRHARLQPGAVQKAAVQFGHRFHAGRRWSPNSPRILIVAQGSAGRRTCANSSST